jgi:8-oxo-dGTP pyrophosphatase MutT (NUDIX family)
VRDTRYQGAVVHDRHVLVVRVELADGGAFWLLPGGGREALDDSAEACVLREIREETGLEVDVQRLLYEMAAHPDDARYRRWRTYLCGVRAGEIRPGAQDDIAVIAAAAWLPLSDDRGWPSDIRSDRFLYPQLLRIAKLLGGEAAEQGR